jgi:Mce-associated membrane protein
VLIAVTLLCAAAAGLNYLVVYRQEQAIDTARAEIADQGPGIVEQMLSYKRETLQQDFAHAQSLTTEEFRPLFIAQQQMVQNSGVTTNELWAVSSAVLPESSDSPDRAAMLMAMQGQRGDNPKDLKFAAATLRVDFEKSDDGQWRVANLTVLKRPQTNAPGR